MELIIDFDKIQDQGKKDWLLRTLKLMAIDFKATEKRQTLEEYNKDLEDGNDEIERGDFMTTDQLRIESKKW